MTQPGHYYFLQMLQHRQPHNVKAGGGTWAASQATAFLALTLFAALSMSAATASGFET